MAKITSFFVKKKKKLHHFSQNLQQNKFSKKKFSVKKSSFCSKVLSTMFLKKLLLYLLALWAKISKTYKPYIFLNMHFRTL
jgi:hypothetical protein